jgi:hypothetical protein
VLARWQQSREQCDGYWRPNCRRVPLSQLSMGDVHSGEFRHRAQVALTFSSDFQNYVPRFPSRSRDYIMREIEAPTEKWLPIRELSRRNRPDTLCASARTCSRKVPYVGSGSRDYIMTTVGPTTENNVPVQELGKRNDLFRQRFTVRFARHLFSKILQEKFPIFPRPGQFTV